VVGVVGTLSVTDDTACVCRGSFISGGCDLTVVLTSGDDCAGSGGVTDDTADVAVTGDGTVVDTAGELSVESVVYTAYDTAGILVKAVDRTVVGTVGNGAGKSGVSGVVNVEDTYDTAGAMPTGNVTVVYTVDDLDRCFSTNGLVVKRADDTAGVSVTKEGVCAVLSFKSLYVSVVYDVVKSDGAFAGNHTSERAACPVAVVLSVVSNDLTVDGEVLCLTAEFPEHRLAGYGYGLAVTVENAGEVLLIRFGYSDVIREVVISVFLHSKEFSLVCDRCAESVGGNLERADREDHAKSQNGCKKLFHNVFPFYVIG
jgi:hypothetical protein